MGTAAAVSHASSTATLSVLIAPDKFKGTLSARAAGEAIAAGVQNFARARQLSTTLAIRPLADGGEGSREILAQLRPDLEERRLAALDSGERPVTVRALIDPPGAAGRRAWLESAEIIGLLMPGAAATPILDRTTRGVGAAICGCLDLADRSGASAIEEVGIFLGGSATSDGGFGLAGELGFRFLDANARSVTRLHDLLKVTRVLRPERRFPVRLTLYTDVQSPLCGPAGAARLFAAQKGATPVEIEMIEARMQHLARLFQAEFGADAQTPGCGAAGGLGFPLLALPEMQARFVSGVDFFIQAAQLHELIDSARPAFLISGEGRTDRGSLSGKVVAGLARLCQARRGETSASALAGTPALVIVSGQVQDRDLLEAAGLRSVYSTVDVCGALTQDGLSPELAAARLTLTTERALADLTGFAEQSP
jgi:glycerate kinase